LKRQGAVNCLLDGKSLTKHVPPDDESRNLLDNANDQLALSLRAVNRVLRVARTIADISGSECVESSHVVEALSYRQRR